jgi:hypothetical protein
MDNLDDKVFCLILEIVAYKIWEDCKALDIEFRGIKFGENILQYADLARVSWRFNFFMENCVTVNGQLFKNTLLDMAEANFSWVLLTTKGMPSRENIWRNCGAVWANPRLGKFLGTFFQFFGGSGNEQKPSVFGTLFDFVIFSNPRALGPPLKKPRECALFGREEQLGYPFFLPEPVLRRGDYPWFTSTLDDGLLQPVNPKILTFVLGRYPTEYYKTIVPVEFWGDGMYYSWTGVPLMYFKAEAATMKQKFESEETTGDGECECGRYWLWFCGLPGVLVRNLLVVDVLKKKMLIWAREQGDYMVRKMS